MHQDIKNSFLSTLDEFTPQPFWFWNDSLTEEEISRQIHDFHSKGVMGFVIHPRIGIPEDIPYMSPKFLHFVKYAVEEAFSLGMKVVLYDEAMYPSGSAHGMVVKDDPQYATRCLEMTMIPCPCQSCPTKVWEYELKLPDTSGLISIQAVQKATDGSILPDSTSLLTHEQGKVHFQIPDRGEWNLCIFTEEFSHGTIRGIHFGEDDREAGAPPSGDLMNPDAMKKFIRLTYEGYYQILKDYFGTTVIAMFTDEPDVMGRFSRPDTMPWTVEFLDWYLCHGGAETDLPLLWLEDAASREHTESVRRTFKKAVNKRLEFAYYSQISSWCEQHGISLTGHPAQSDDIGFLKYFQIPGQDLVWRWVAPEDNKGIEGSNSTMGKCSSDAARHSGRRRNSNECFGCCGPDGIGWAFTADDMKWYLDWMFVRGVNLLYPHAFYYSLRGEGRYGERPPDVGPHNAWWQYYDQIADYIKRCCYLLTDSYNVTPIAILCEEDHLPWHLARFFFQNQIEFNYLEVNLLMSHACTIHDGSVSIEKQEYKVLMIEDNSILTPMLRERLRKFTSGGGRVILLPDLSDAPNIGSCQCGNVKTCSFLSDSVMISQELSSEEGLTEVSGMEEVKNILCEILQPDVSFSPPNSDIRVTHIVKEDYHFYLVTNEGEDTVLSTMRTTLTGKAQLWDPWRGTITRAKLLSHSENGLELSVWLPRRESIVVSILPCHDDAGIHHAAAAEEPLLTFCRRINGTLSAGPVPYMIPNTPAESVVLNSHWSVHTDSGISLQDIPLESWTNWEQMEHFYGTARYSIQFPLNTIHESRRYLLDLGVLHSIAHLTVNGQDAGVKLWGPYQFDITSLLHKGMNTLTAAITNTPANDLNGTKLPSGLEGPVTLSQIIIPDGNL